MPIIADLNAAQNVAHYSDDELFDYTRCPYIHSDLHA